MHRQFVAPDPARATRSGGVTSNQNRAAMAIPAKIVNRRPRATPMSRIAAGAPTHKNPDRGHAGRIGYVPTSRAVDKGRVHGRRQSRSANVCPTASTANGVVEPMARETRCSLRFWPTLCPSDPRRACRQLNTIGGTWGVCMDSAR